MLNEDTLRVSLVQQDIAWEDKGKNLAFMENIISFHAQSSDLIVFPEMCTTGFTMNSRALAEGIDGETIACLKKWSKTFDVSLCGSFIASERDQIFNRGFFITPDCDSYYDKRHLFRMGNEPQYFDSGNKRLLVEYKGFKICLLICYDLRFPVWARNVDNEYDLLIYVANWPASRAQVWKTLLTARAIENMSYVCGVNRYGTDGNGLDYNGGSAMFDAKGYEMTSMVAGEDIETVAISKNELEKFRMKFPVWKDADRFDIII